MKKIIYDITRFTTTDYPDHLSCVVWFTSCNMRCIYCYNKNIVDSTQGKYSLEDLYFFLKKRIGLLDSVVLSGGEATSHDLIEVCKEIKKLGFKIKLDTNGTNPKLVKTLLEQKLLDFVALDFKAPKYKFKEITKSNSYGKFLEVLKTLLDDGINFEVRTTIHPDLLNYEDINEMIEVLVKMGYRNTYYLQNFLDAPNFGNLKKSSTLFEKFKVRKDLNIIFRN